MDYSLQSEIHGSLNRSVTVNSFNQEVFLLTKKIHPMIITKLTCHKAYQKYIFTLYAFLGGQCIL